MTYLSSRLKTGQNGFSLLEVLLYLGLFALLLSSLVFLGFTMRDRSQKLRTNWESLSEINFIHDKIRYLLNESVIITPPPEASSDYLELRSRDGYEEIIIKAADQQLQIERDGNAFPLAHEQYKIMDSSFTQSVKHRLKIKFTFNETAYIWHVQTYPESP